MARSRARCFYCHRPVEICGRVSKRGCCEDCAIERMRTNTLIVNGVMEAAHDEWRAAWIAGCGKFGRPTTPYPPGA